jgi:uncharacterized protein YjiS (DUF1127 family)
MAEKQYSWICYEASGTSTIIPFWIRGSNGNAWCEILISLRINSFCQSPHASLGFRSQSKEKIMSLQIRQKLEAHASQPLERGSGATDLFVLLAAVFCRIKRYRALARQRHELAQLSDDQLEDIGLTREAAEKEAGKPFWVE